ncbi:hypothetical protein C8Q78DRAFT_1076487 [Trametes maxima]|nr:hypothetical protein C8Q78DRAFT_1076487 [Trametes maxima]
MTEETQASNPSDENTVDDSVVLGDNVNEEELRKRLADANEIKQEGNEHFRAKQWDQALASYRSALGHLPKRSDLSQVKGKEKAQLSDDSASGPGEEAEAAPAKPSEGIPSDPNLAPLQAECAKARAVLNANIGACFTKLVGFEDHKEVVSACSESLKDDPNYVKAMQRRAAANEQIGSWSSLTSAQEDYKRLLELLPPNSPDLVGIRRSLVALPPRIEAAQKQETSEMLDKLKGLGNSILGNFGLSTDNFQFVPNGQGGYSMNFVR